MSAPIRDILSRYGEQDQENVWKVQSTWVIKHACLERIAAKAGIVFRPPQILRAERDEAVILVTGVIKEGTGREEWSIGEALVNGNYRITGKMAAYPYAMAEKRAKDRVILKLIGLHGLAYSEEEADEFRERNAADPAPQNGKRTRQEISANAQRKTRDHDGVIADLADIQSLASLERFKREVLTPEFMAGLGNGQYLIEERVAAKEAELNAPAEDEPDATDEQRMDYIRGCLSIIEEARTRTELADWWNGQRPRRRALGLSKTQVDGLKQAVSAKRDSLPGGRTDTPYAKMQAVDGRELSVITDAG